MEESKIKQAIVSKIKEYESFLLNPNYQSDMERNVVMCVLRELNYLDSIVEYDEIESKSLPS